MRTLSTALALLWPFICHLTLASLNLVMPSDEVIRLLGVNDGRGGSGGVWELAATRTVWKKSIAALNPQNLLSM